MLMTVTSLSPETIRVSPEEVRSGKKDLAALTRWGKRVAIVDGDRVLAEMGCAWLETPSVLDRLRAVLHAIRR